MFFHFCPTISWVENNFFTCEECCAKKNTCKVPWRRNSLCHKLMTQTPFELRPIWVLSFGSLSCDTLKKLQSLESSQQLFSENQSHWRQSQYQFCSDRCQSGSDRAYLRQREAVTFKNKEKRRKRKNPKQINLLNSQSSGETKSSPAGKLSPSVELCEVLA